MQVITKRNCLSKEEYIDRINNSKLFDVDEATSPVLYKSVRLELLENLTHYYNFYVYGPNKFPAYQLALIEVADGCIRSYKKDKGLFLNYFNFSFKNNRDRLLKEDFDRENGGGIKLDSATQKKIKALKKFAKQIEAEVQDDGFIKKASAGLGWQVEEVKKLVNLILHPTLVVSENQRVGKDKDEDGSLYDTVADETDVTAEDDIEMRYALTSLLDKIERVVNEKRRDGRKLYAAIVTRYVLKAFDCDIRIAKEILDGRVFHCEEVIEYARTYGDCPNNEDLAEMLDLAPESVSRSSAQFVAALKAMLPKNRIRK